MKYNYSKLLGRMKERGISQELLAQGIGVNVSTLNSKLNNRFCFKTDEMDAICKVLDIPNIEIGEYFFCTKSLDFQTE